MGDTVDGGKVDGPEEMCIMEEGRECWDIIFKEKLGQNRKADFIL